MVYEPWFTSHGLRSIVYEPWFTSHGLRSIVYEPWFTEAEVNRGPSRGTPWWPPQPLALLLEFVIVHVISVVQASFATSGFLFHGNTLDCAEHSLQYGM